MLYISCFADDPSNIQSNAWYIASNDEKEIAVYYDTQHASQVSDIDNMGTSLLKLRIAPWRHGTGANAVYLDGHAASVPWTEIIKIPLWDDGDYPTRPT